MLANFVAEFQSFLPVLNPGQISALEAHLALLERWNRSINLTGIKARNETIRRHVGESLFLAAHLPAGVLRICDLGSGGGFPGIPVAIVRPDCEVSLVESDVRKVVFLREASRNLRNVRVVTGRFESVQGEFDWVVSRAVNLATVFGGPVCANAAFLGFVVESASGGTKPNLAVAYDWEQFALPWDLASFLSVGARR